MEESISAGFNSTTSIGAMLPILVHINSCTFIMQSCKDPFQWAAELLRFPITCVFTPSKQDILEFNSGIFSI